VHKSTSGIRWAVCYVVISFVASLACVALFALAPSLVALASSVPLVSLVALIAQVAFVAFVLLYWFHWLHLCNWCINLLCIRIIHVYMNNIKGVIFGSMPSGGKCEDGRLVRRPQFVSAFPAALAFTDHDLPTSLRFRVVALPPNGTLASFRQRL
jgi:hypothetical protein